MAKNYINKETLRLEVIKSLAEGKLTPKCVELFQLMIDKQQTSFKYVDYQDKEDTNSHAMEVVLKNWHKYDPTRFNAFSYYTSMIYNGLYAGWNELTKKRADFSLSNIFTESV
jgi:hypothetical protein